MVKRSVSIFGIPEASYETEGLTYETEGLIWYCCSSILWCLASHIHQFFFLCTIGHNNVIQIWYVITRQHNSCNHHGLKSPKHIKWSPVCPTINYDNRKPSATSCDVAGIPMSVVIPHTSLKHFGFLFMPWSYNTIHS